VAAVALCPGLVAGGAAMAASFSAAVAPAGAARWGKAIEVPGTYGLGESAGVSSVSCSSAGNCSAAGVYFDGGGVSRVFVVSQVKGEWGKAIEVPDPDAFPPGGGAVASSVSCSSAGDCAAAGYYSDGSGHDQAFVVGQVNGRWGQAIEVPGTAALNAGGNAAVSSVSCSSAGNCSAAGFYTDGSGHDQAFVASQVNGTWGQAIEMPGTAALNAGGEAAVSSVSCSSAGDCAAAGYYTDGSGDRQAFVASQVNGNWGQAIEVPGTAALNAGGGAAVSSVSCSSAGDCAAAGYYTDGSGDRQAFVASQVNGNWGQAIEVPGTAALNTDGNAEVTSVSCSSAGNCAAAGQYLTREGGDLAFVVSQVNGTWGQAIEVPGIAGLDEGDSPFTSVSCSSAGNCTAAGGGFVVSQVNGRWGQAIQVPGIAALNYGRVTQARSVSCSSAGNCSTGGSYSDGSDPARAFAVSQVNGTWGKAVQVPGTAALGVGGYILANLVSCSSAGNCGVAGGYADRSGNEQAFVASQVNGKWGKAIQAPGTARLNPDGFGAIGSVSCSSARNCSAVGSFGDSSGYASVLNLAFAVSQVNGKWGKAIQVRGLNDFTSVSCSSPGNCSAAGTYDIRAYVVSQVKGRWGKVIEVPGIAALGGATEATVNSMSCSSPGNCGASGYYYAVATNDYHAFVVSQVNGKWGKAIEVQGPDGLSSVSCSSPGNCSAVGSGFAVSQVKGRWGQAIEVQGPDGLSSVSCSSAGNCSAAGGGFVVSQVKGRWGQAIEVPGTAALAALQLSVSSVSCSSAGNCGAAGYYDTSNREQAFVVSQVNGRWGRAIEVPGTAALGAGGGAEASSVSCSPAGTCSAAGDYTDRSGREQAFVVSEVKGRWGEAIKVPGTGTLGTGE
jgi:D-alanine-D-alanine ligase-like ATP-grasp enzyme